MSTELHILFLCSWYPSRISPSNGDFIQRHAQTVAQQHRVSVLHIITDPSLNKKIAIQINQENKLTEYIVYVKPANSVTKLIRFWEAFKQVYKKLDKVDVVHVNRLYPMGLIARILKLKYRIPYIISEHWTGYHREFKKKLSSTELLCSKMIVKNAHYVCPVSQHLATSMKELGLLGRYTIVPNVVDTQLFTPDKKTINNTHFKILHISSLNNDHKNITGMIAAAKKLAESILFEWYFVGGSADEFKEELNDFKNKDSKLIFVEPVAHEIIPSYLNQADVFVMFSNYENLPCVILEAFACGIPVVSSNVGGIEEYFPKEFGSLIPKNDVSALLKALKEIQHKGRVDRDRMHLYAKENFSSGVICQSFTNLYQKSLL